MRDKRWKRAWNPTTTKNMLLIGLCIWRSWVWLQARVSSPSASCSRRRSSRMPGKPFGTRYGAVGRLSAPLQCSRLSREHCRFVDRVLNCKRMRWKDKIYPSISTRCNWLGNTIHNWNHTCFESTADDKYRFVNFPNDPPLRNVFSMVWVPRSNFWTGWLLAGAMTPCLTDINFSKSTWPLPIVAVPIRRSHQSVVATGGVTYWN